MGVKRWSDDELEEALKTSKTYKEIASKLGLRNFGNKVAFRKRILDLELETSHLHKPRSHPEDELRKIVASSYSYGEVARKLGHYRNIGPNAGFRKQIDFLKISTVHFDNALVKKQPNRTLEEILVKGDKYYNTTRLKERLYKAELKAPYCELDDCGQGEEWLGVKISLILDHINGDSMDNRIENLRIVCPNCGATLETHCK